MPSIIKSNVSLVVSNNQAKRAEFFEGVAKAMNRAELLFISKIQEDRMHRQKTGVGTNVRTGMLRRDWFNSTIRQNQQIKALVWSTTPYAPGLEEGGAVEVAGHMVRPTKIRKREKAVRKPYWQSGYFVNRKAILGVGTAWDNNFLPMLEKEIIAMAAKTFH